MKYFFKKILFRFYRDNYKKSFTYYLPAPPARKTGYQEKEFDKIIQYISENDYKIASINLQAHSGVNSSGTWLCCEVIPLTFKAAKNPLNCDQFEIHPHSASSPLHEDLIYEN